MTSVKFLEKSHEKCRLTILPSCATGVILTCAVGVYRAHRAHANIRELKIADKSKILINFINYKFSPKMSIVFFIVSYQSSGS